MVGSILWILFVDFEAFKFAKKDLDWSRMCFGLFFGDVGKGGSEVKIGDPGSRDGWRSLCASIPLFDLKLGEALRSCSRMGLLGDGDLLLGSVGDVMALLTGDAVLGVATDKVCGMAMTPAFVICLRPRPLRRFLSSF